VQRKLATVVKVPAGATSLPDAPWGSQQHDPTPAQAAALRELTAAIDARSFAPFLLHGVTGSGKTWVYLEAIAHARSLGLGALTLVPEIALTPQLAGRFRARFGEDVAVLHSGLSERERLNEWTRVRDGRAGIVVGDTSSYLIGRSFLPALLRSKIGKRLVSTDLRAWAEDLVSRHGFRAILLGRFLVALRGPVYLAIGAAKYPMARFELLNGLVGLFEVAILVGLGYVFGRSTRVEHRAIWLEIGVAVIMAMILIIPPLFKWRMVKKHRAR